MDLSVLNKEQKEAVLYNDGPLLIIAGAGSGKTRVLTYKVAYLIEQGVDPSSILAITFTNKAADEMKERIYGLLENKINGRPFVSTFHRFCGTILSKYIDSIGYKSRYVIYDREDQKKTIKHIIRDLYGEDSKLNEEKVQKIINKCKSRNISNIQYKDEDDYDKKISECFDEYENRLKRANALDFDDMLIKAVEILKNNDDALKYYSEKYKYVLIDEYQDTNGVQFELIQYLTYKYKYITAVGDEDQSIYKFRGADIHNIYDFEDNFKNAKIIKMTQNYRSTKQILDVANSLIKNNTERKAPKEMWCNNKFGRKVVYYDYPNDDTEAYQTIKRIKDNNDYRNTCILYRNNALSRKFEKMCIDMSVPYKIIGGLSFYQRKEVKDIFAYLKLIINSDDDISLLRIINVPKRGIGETSVNKICNFANMQNISIYSSLLKISDIELTKKATNAINCFVSLIGELKKCDNIQSIIQKILTSGYEDEINNNEDNETARDKILNIHEIENDFLTYKDILLNNNENIDAEKLNIKNLLYMYLNNAMLYEVTDELNAETGKLNMLTVHASKGLEYDNVYIVGLNHEVFPSSHSLKAKIENGDETYLQEERRLMYVGITRAKKNLYLSSSRFRSNYTGFFRSNTSEFITNDIDNDLLDISIVDDEYSNYSNYTSNKYNKYYNNTNNSYNNKHVKKYNNYDDIDFEYAKNKRPKTIFENKVDVYKMGQDIEKPKDLSYGVGDKVIHKKFGEGEVKSIVDVGRDYEVKVDFYDEGEKTLFAKFAKLEKI